MLRDGDDRIFIEQSPRLFPYILAFLQNPTEPIEGVAEVVRTHLLVGHKIPSVLCLSCAKNERRR